MTDHRTTPTQRTGAAPKRRRRGLRNTLIVLGSLIVLLGVAAGIGYAILANSFNEIQRVSIEQDPSLPRPDPVAPQPDSAGGAPVNILLLGSDSREATDTSLDAADMTGFRSDSIMVAQVAPDGEHVTVMSIMRDNWVEIQGYGEAKINAAMSYGGLPLAVNTIENFIGARIDHVALVDFESFKGLTDAVGGVTVTNDQAFTSMHGVTFEAGRITLGGDEALGFVRERYAFSDGDYQRARNQQAYMKGLASTVLSRETLGDPGKLINTFEALKPYLILDDGFDLAAVTGLGFGMRDVRSDDIRFFTSPTLGTGESADGQSIVIPDREELARVQDAFRAGTLHEYAATRAPGSELP
ncbi:LCP family protein [Leucobacter sp.]